MYMYIYIYIYTHIHIHDLAGSLPEGAPCGPAKGGFLNDI